AKWSGLVVALALLAGIATGLWYWYAVEPRVAGTITLPGFDKPVEIVRDKEGVAHIFAETDADAAAALGFVHAQD
uniref:penicillin acylase family protein n=1 Tax=Streptococcus pneumoniae TaxID=1313 RepID=UPI001954DB62